MLLGLPTIVAAQQSSTESQDSTVNPNLDPVVVTATRTAAPRSTVSQSVTVLRGDDLRTRGVTNVATALREVPGLSVVQNGSYGGVTSVFLRGGESRYTKVLIDGVAVNEVGGAFYFQNLTTDNIDRIEVLRGPASALYGADAMTGVIQIFTKRGSGPLHLDASSNVGSYGSRGGDLNVRGGSDLINYSLGGAFRRTDGIFAFNNQYHNGTVSGAFGLTPGKNTSIRLTTRYTDAEQHYPTDQAGAVVDSNAYYTQRRFVAGVDASHDFNRFIKVQVLGGTNEVRDLSEDINTAVAGGITSLTKESSPGNGYRRNGELRTVLGLSSYGLLTLGAQYQKEFQRTISRTRVYTGSLNTTPTDAADTVQNHRLTHGYYAAINGAPLHWLGYDASVRLDDHSDYSNVTTFHTGVSVGLLPQTRLRVSYGTAFNATAFYQTQGSAYNLANPSLKPERANTINATLEQSLFDGRIRASFGAYDQRFSDMIQYAYDAGTNTARYENMTQVRSKGYEGELHVIPVRGMSIDASYTQNIAKVSKISPAYTGSLLPGDDLLRRPSHSGNLNVSYLFPRQASFSVATSYVGKRADMDFTQYPSPRVTLPSYVRVDLSTSVPAIRTPIYGVDLMGRVENAFDKKYEDILFFRTPGRAYFFGARVTSSR